VSALNKSNSSDTNNAPTFQSQPDFGHEQTQHKDFYPSSNNFQNKNASKPAAPAKPAQKKKERHYCMDTVEAEEPEVVENNNVVAAEDQNDLEAFLRQNINASNKESDDEYNVIPVRTIRERQYALEEPEGSNADASIEQQDNAYMNPPPVQFEPVEAVFNGQEDDRDALNDFLNDDEEDNTTNARANASSSMNRGPSIHVPVLEEIKEEAPLKNKPPVSAKPRVMSTNPSSEAQDFIKKLDKAMRNNDQQLLSDLIFDAECEGLEDQIDLQWYSQQAATLVEQEMA
jgi:hypothetical protein